jgi:hypothetical protein
MNFLSPLLAMLASLFLLVVAPAAPPVTIEPTTLHGRPHHRVITPTATWLYDDAGGGFASLLDPTGADWIGFNPVPLTDFPASAASGYRGLGNLVHGGDDGGVGHPGFDKCTTEFIPPATLRTHSQSGRWEWSWTFHADHAEFILNLADSDRAWWLLYEGTPGGRFSPTEHTWGNDDATPRTERPAISSQLREPMRTVWFGHKNSAYRLVLTHHTDSPAICNLWWMGNAAKGQWSDSTDGMVVFGFGRGTSKEGPLLRGPQRFTVALRPAKQP